MGNRSRFRRWARLSLLLAALLYGAGPALDPLLHGDDGTAAFAGEDGDRPPLPPTSADGDSFCFACQNLGSAAELPVVGHVFAKHVTERVEGWHGRARPESARFARYQPRGPPPA